MGVFKERHGCVDRVLGCHSTCERYAGEVEKNEKLKAARDADKDCRAYAYQMKRNNMAKQALKKKYKVDVRLNYK